MLPLPRFPCRFLILTLLATLSAPTASVATWVVNEAGQCVEVWSTSSLADGPTAIAGAAVLPFRCALGGRTIVPDDLGTWSPLATSGVMLVSGAFGMLEGATWVVRGVIDTVTGGYFGVSPDRATTWSWKPTLPFPILADVDPCGRPLQGPEKAATIQTIGATESPSDISIARLDLHPMAQPPRASVQ